MTGKYRYEITRRSIICETYWVEADTKEEAIEICQNGCAEDPQLEFIDWYDDAYQVESTECIDPLYRMVKDHKTVDNLEL